MTIEIRPVPAFQDNYIWFVRQDEAPWVVIDPGEAGPAEGMLGEQAPAAILLTHHHGDHVGGVAALRQRYHGVPVYGPADVPMVDHPLKGGERVGAGGMVFRVLATPGHTLDHLCYVLEGDRPALFSGDTLFSGGSGRLFEGTAEQLFAGFRQFDTLPDETLLCPGHEYTRGNLRFIASLGEESPALAARQEAVDRCRAADSPSVPVPLGVERQTNPFLMAPSAGELARLRKLKDDF